MMAALQTGFVGDFVVGGWKTFGIFIENQQAADQRNDLHRLSKQD